jgi:hypothetical protein
MESKKMKNWSEQIMSKVYPILFKISLQLVLSWFDGNHPAIQQAYQNDKIFGSYFRQIIQTGLRSSIVIRKSQVYLK